MSRGGRLEPQVKEAGGEFIYADVASKNPAIMARNVVAISRIVRSRGCDIIHAHGRAPAWSAFAASRLTRVPFVTSWYKGFREQNALKRLYNSVMARGDRIIAVSDQLAELISERYHVPPTGSKWCRRASIFRISIRRRFRPIAPRRCAAHSASPHSDKVIFVVGRMLRRKGHHVAVRAARRLKEMGLKDFVFVFVGEDEGHSRYTGDLWDEVAANDLTSRGAPDRPGRRHAGGLCGFLGRGLGRNPGGRIAARDPGSAGDGTAGGGVRSRRRTGRGAVAADGFGGSHDRLALFGRRRCRACRCFGAAVLDAANSSSAPSASAAATG